MKKINNILVKVFHCANLILIILSLYRVLKLKEEQTSIQPQITRDFIISSNHFYAFIFYVLFHSISYKKNKKINFLINYLFLLSIVLEFISYYYSKSWI